MERVAEILVRLIVSAALLYFVLRSIDLAALWERVQGTNPAWILLALAAFTFMQSVSVWRWHRLLRAQHIDVTSRTLTESIWVSLFFNNFLPSNIGGDFVRIADTARAAGSKTLATTVVLVDRVWTDRADRRGAVGIRVWRHPCRERAGCGSWPPPGRMAIL
jgi:uncharacterized protein (TIRG00374 family)